ncbi:putative membrane protein [Klebsiella michiganensis]|nr:putative membrane protein [Klebsiella michiganensis]
MPAQLVSSIISVSSISQCLLFFPFCIIYNFLCFLLTPEFFFTLRFFLCQLCVFIGLVALRPSQFPFFIVILFPGLKS